MKNTIFTGAGVAIITPMLEDGSVDYAGLGKNIDFQIENGTDATVSYTHLTLPTILRV